MSYVEVAINLPVDGLYTYAMPANQDLLFGQVVLVPFGRQKATGYVVAFSETTELKKPKRVLAVLDQRPAFTHQQLRLFRWVAQYYLSGLGEVIATALPTQFRQRPRLVYVADEHGVDALAEDGLQDEAQAMVLREIISRPKRTLRGLQRILHDELTSQQTRRCIDALVNSGFVQTEESSLTTSPLLVKTVVSSSLASRTKPRLGHRMKTILEALDALGGPVDVRRLVAQYGPGSHGVLRRLQHRGLVEFGHREDREGTLGESLPGREDPHLLNSHQQQSVQRIQEAQAGTFLLHGVTGSGKTEVYLQAAAKKTQGGGDVLILVPEIALTPLLMGRVRARFGDRIAVLHSRMTPKARFREWRRIRTGDVNIAIGARSAVFAPFRDLALIVVDEEHDDSYKQGDGVRYNARDVAVVRATMAGCPVVLGSATPSLETWQNGESGKYTVLALPDRATSKPVPKMEVIDTRGLSPDQLLAPQTAAALHRTLDAGSQAIVLYNRRGYANVVECPGCGAYFACPSCGVNLILHQSSRKLKCHYCGFYRRYTEFCGSCDSPFNILGHGTERVEESLSRQFPGVRMARMDADTTSGKDGHFRILEEFRTGGSQLLVGTQIVAKGHDFPGVTLAVVLGIDHVLMLPDFRSAERTFALVTQLAGRAGRGDEAGRVIVQTRHPQDTVFRQLDRRDAPDTDVLDCAFYSHLLGRRRLLRYPPFTRLVLVRVEGADREESRSVGALLVDELRRDSKTHSVDIFGPVLAPLSRLVGRWRFQIVIRGHQGKALRKWLNAHRQQLRARRKRGVRISVDVDPRSLL